MTRKWTLLSIGLLLALAFSPSTSRGADAVPMVVTGFTGSMNIHQNIPCGSVDRTTQVADGRITITPSEGIDVSGGKLFAVTGANLSFNPFSLSGSCAGFGQTRNYSALNVSLARAVSFTAPPAGGGAYSVTIAKDDFLIYEVATVNNGPETGYKHPSQDVTGTIDLTNGTVSMTVVLATLVHFEAGCIDGHCVFSEDDPGTITTELTGTIVFPDSDGDGVPDRVDNCRFVPNPDQTPVPNPVITAPPALTINSCLDHHIGAPSAADVCNAAPVTVSNNAPGTFALGANTVTWTVTDQSAQTASATQTVTVVDTTPPVFTFIPPDITRNDCGPVNLGTPTATDDCGGTVTFSNNAPASFGVGDTPVTWTARDVSGNRSTATQMVTVHDTVPPTVSCVAVQSPGDSFLASAFDACGTTTIKLGTYVIANGEVIKIDETGQSGVQLVNDVSSDGVRHFHVGKGEGVLVATDGSGNVASAVCR
jgi:hypothetical protein